MKRVTSLSDVNLEVSFKLINHMIEVFSSWSYGHLENCHLGASRIIRRILVPFMSSSPMRYLGIMFSADLTDLHDLNFIPKFQKLKDILRIWSCRDLTPVGKIAVIKSLGLSQLIFLLSVLPDPPSHFIKELDSVIYKFIWSGKPDKVKRLTVIGDTLIGDFGCVIFNPL